MRNLFVTFLFLLFSKGIVFAGNVDSSKIAMYFIQYDSLCRVDNGKLWGKTLFGPLLIVDRETKMVYSNQKDKYGHFTKTGSFYTGIFPDSLALGNSAVDWLDDHWTQVALDRLDFLPDIRSSFDLLMHESFHRLQRELDLELSYKQMPHLNTFDGRYWLIMEHRALLSALSCKGEEAKKAVRDALLFRNYRRSLFPDAVESENGLEVLEGTAEYTGNILAGFDRQEILRQSEQSVEKMPDSDMLAREYAYRAGVLYGLLLDEKCPGWKPEFLLIKDFGKQLELCCNINIPLDLKKKYVYSRITPYDGERLLAEEKEREDRRIQTIEKYRKMFFSDKVYIVSLEKTKNFTINSSLSIPLDFGTVYDGLRFAADWGILTISGEVLVDPKFDKVYLPYDSVKIDGNIVSSEIWKISFNEGWEMEDIILTASQMTE